MYRYLAGALLLATVLGRGPDASAEESEPRRKPHETAASRETSRALELFANEDYEAAVWAFEVSYQLTPQPDLLYAAAQAERMSGDCNSAIVYYKRFLAENPPEAKASAARANLDRCEKALRTRPVGLIAERPAIPRVRFVEPADQGFRAYLGDDTLGRSLLLASVSSVALGTALLVASRSDAETFATRGYGLTGLAAGSALLSATLYRYTTWNGDRQRNGRRIIVRPLAGGAALSVVATME